VDLRPLVVDSERKKMWSGKTSIDIYGRILPYPIIFEVTGRYIQKTQKLLLPDIEIDSYWCSMDEMAPAEVVELYHDQGTSEQFHSEIKSNMRAERLPSGNFASNSLVLLLTMLSYNMLRIIGQQWVEIDTEEGSQPLASRRKKVFRRRILTVMQDIVYMAGRLIKTGREFFISFGQINPFAILTDKIGTRILGSIKL
jgi:hypothetical protein